MKPDTRGKGKFDPHRAEGIWLGLADRTGEVIVGANEGAIKARDVRSKEVNEAWNWKKFNQMKGPRGTDPRETGNGLESQSNHSRREISSRWNYVG